MGAKSRRKGATGERELVALVKGAGFDKAHRTAPMQAAQDGAQAYADLGEVPGLYVESKRYKTTPVHQCVREVEGKRGRVAGEPVLAYRNDNEGWRVNLDARFFFAAWNELHELRGALALAAWQSRVVA